MIRTLVLGLLLAVVLAVAGFAGYVASRQDLKFDAPYPEIAATTDSSIVERGRYLVRDVAQCAQCHGDTKRMAERDAGQEVALSGGYFWDIPPGTFYARNITPDSATGIGALDDKAIARALRHGVGSDGRALLPFMELQGLSDEDLVAVISYLRTQPAVANPIPAHEYNLLGKVVRATILANPVGPEATPPKATPHGATVENGRYLVESVALCWACHTQRNEATGQLSGPRFGGATGFIEPSDPANTWSPPNITSDPATGKLGALDEEAFVARFRTGRVLPKSPMPWQGYMRMSDEDLRAMYRYLTTVPAVNNDVGPPLVPVKTKA